MLIDLTCVLDKLKSICSVRAFYKLIIDRDRQRWVLNVCFFSLYSYTALLFARTCSLLGLLRLQTWPNRGQRNALVKSSDDTRLMNPPRSDAALRRVVHFSYFSYFSDDFRNHLWCMCNVKHKLPAISHFEVSCGYSNIHRSWKFEASILQSSHRFLFEFFFHFANCNCWASTESHTKKNTGRHVI